MKKIVSLLIVFSLILSMTTGAFAFSPNEVKMNNETKKVLLHSIDTKDKSSKEIEKITMKKYKELGIYKELNKVRKEREQLWFKLVKQEIYIEIPESSYDLKPNDKNTSSNRTIITANGTLIDTVNLPAYEGYLSRYLTIVDHYIHPQEDLLDVTNDPIVSILDKSFAVALGFTSPWVWVPATFLGVDASDIAQWLLCIDDTTDDRLYAISSEQLTFKYFQVEDKDNKISSSDWSTNAYTNKSLATLQLTLVAYDKDTHERVTPDYGVKTHTFTCLNYYDAYDMQEKAYYAYKYNYYNGLYTERTTPATVDFMTN